MAAKQNIKHWKIQLLISAEKKIVTSNEFQYRNCQKKPNLRQKKLRIFGIFRQKGGGGSGPIQNFLNRKNLGIQIDRGGLARSEKLKKKHFFYASP